MKRSLRTSPATSPTPVIVAATGLVAVTYGVVRYGYGLQLPQLTAEFGLSPTTAGLIASGSFAAYCVAGLLARRIVPRSPRSALWLAAGLAAGGAGVVAAASSPTVVAAGVLVAGGAAGAASPALVQAVAAAVPTAREARAQAVVNAGTGVGVVAVGAAVLAAPQVWRPVWVVAAVAALVAAAVVDRRTPWASRSSPSPSSVDGDGRGTGGPRPASLRRPVVAAVVAGAGSAAVWTFGRDVVTTTGGLPERTTAALWVLLGAAAVLGASSGDVVRVLGLGRAWVLTAGLSGLATAALVLAPDRVGLVAGAAALFGGAYTALSGVLIAWAGERPGRRRPCCSRRSRPVRRWEPPSRAPRWNGPTWWSCPGGAPPRCSWRRCSGRPPSDRSRSRPLRLRPSRRSDACDGAPCRARSRSRRARDRARRGTSGRSRPS